MKKILICDIDGVVCDSSERFKMFVEEKIEEEHRKALYKACLSSLPEDKPIEIGIKTVKGIYKSLEEPKIVWIKARFECSRKNTEIWLNKHVKLPIDTLVMQPHTEHISKFRGSTDYKETILDEMILPNFEVLAAIDDHDGVCEMYRAKGINTIHLSFNGIDCVTPGGVYELLPYIGN